MKNEMKNLAKKAVEDIASKPISRKEAIKKTGYMAVSAATMMLLLNTPAQAKSSGGSTSVSVSVSNQSSKTQGNNQRGTKDNGIWK